jgi:hypothetical protein
MAHDYWARGRRAHGCRRVRTRTIRTFWRLSGVGPRPAGCRGSSPAPPISTPLPMRERLETVGQACEEPRSCETVRPPVRPSKLAERACPMQQTRTSDLRRDRPARAQPPPPAPTLNYRLEQNISSAGEPAVIGYQRAERLKYVCSRAGGRSGNAACLRIGDTLLLKTPTEAQWGSPAATMPCS